MMELEWDEEKQEANLLKHKVLFSDVVPVFLDERRIVAVDDRRDYGETRYSILGMIEKRLYVVVYTMRGDVIRIISARKANKREKKRYDDCTIHT